MRVKMVEDEVIVKKIKEALSKNDYYCPCKVYKVEENKCMCKDFRESPVGTICHCGLYEKIEG